MWRPRGAATFLVAALLCPAPVQATVEPARVVPVAAGVPAAVSAETSYAAFPYATEDAAGRTWVAYSSSAGHVSATSDVRVRWADSGKTWSAPAVVVGGSDGYGVQTGGLAAETDAQGGRLWLGVVRYQPTSAVTATSYTTTVRYYDAATSSWSTPTTLPTLGPTQTIGTSLLVRPDGVLLAAAYGTPAGASYTVARVYAYNNTAGTWSALSTVQITGRHAQEPTLVTMADGRILMLLRSDAAAPYYCRLYAAISSDGGATFGTPYLIVVHGSGMPQGFVLPDGQIAVAYRGFAEPSNPASAYPPRIAMLTPDGVATDSALDVTPGVTARYLYGQIVRGPPDRWIYSLEGPGGSTGSGAAVYSVPLTWVERTE